MAARLMAPHPLVGEGSMFRSVLARVAQYFTSPPATPLSSQVSADAHGLSVSLGRRQLEIPWSAIQQVEMYKRDLAAGDLICVRFRYDHDGVSDQVLEINEDVPGYRGVMTQLGRVHPDLNQSWWSSVALPRCATKTLVLWSARAA